MSAQWNSEGGGPLLAMAADPGIADVRIPKTSFVCAAIRRMLGFKMASCSQNSRTLFMNIKAQLDTALAPLSSLILATATRDEVNIGTPICFLCRFLMVRPVCLPCGHSLCKSCLARSTNHIHLTESDPNSIRCPRCQQMWPEVPPGMGGERRSTITLQNAFIRWYPAWSRCCKFREEGNRFAQEGDFTKAVDSYNKALDAGIPDHRVLSNRSRAYLALERLDRALADAELCCKLRPTWSKGHFRRGTVLEKLGQWEEALAAYFLCLHFNSRSSDITPIICQLIDSHTPKKDIPLFTSELMHHLVELCFTRVLSDCGHAGEALQSHEAVAAVKVPSHLVDQSDFECILCTGLLDKPVTVACGHTFCQDCLARSFDHTPFCPVCRSLLSESFLQYTRMCGKMNIDELLEDIILKYFHETCEEKKQQLEVERIQRSRVGLSEDEELPVFVCTVAFPGLPCPLHVFEPQYRLMIRRCAESGSRRFGMCSSLENGSYSSFGTTLCLNTVEHTLDGRSLITTTGEKRFEVLSKSSCDGYNVANIRFIVDHPVTDHQEIVNLRALQQEVYDHARLWLNALPAYARLLLTQTVCCPLPRPDPYPECCPAGPMWVWWYVNALPTTPQRRIEFLKLTSLRERLMMLKDSLPLPVVVSSSSSH